MPNCVQIMAYIASQCMVLKPLWHWSVKHVREYVVFPQYNDKIVPRIKNSV